MLLQMYLDTVDFGAGEVSSNYSYPSMTTTTPPTCSPESRWPKSLPAARAVECTELSAAPLASDIPFLFFSRAPRDHVEDG